MIFYASPNVPTLHAFANPARFLKIARPLTPVLFWLGVVLIAAGSVAGLTMTPPDYLQGETVRILYIHVPAAWLAMMFYSMMALSALGTLVWRHPLADVAQKAAAPIGACFALICLVTGALWGKPMWGTYWVWDARLTSMLVLLLIYLGIIALWRVLDEPSRAGRAVAILTLIGFVNVPIIKFSVDWWNTLHQPASVFRMGGSTLDPSMLWPLLILAAGFTVFALTLHMVSMRAEIMRRRVRTLTILEAERLDRLAAQGAPA